MIGRRAPRAAGLIAAVFSLTFLYGCMTTNNWETDGGSYDEPPGDDPSDPPGGDSGASSPVDDGVSEATQCDGFDNDRDGSIDEGCPCVPGATQECYTGLPTDVFDETNCSPGIQTCQGANEFAAWGPCEGELLPEGEFCWDGIDNNCNGEADEGCSCIPGETRWCYSGPAGTQGVGICQQGVEECIGEGMGWTECVGEVLPEEEICHNDVDDDCDGLVDEDCEPPPAVPIGCTAETLTHVVGAADCAANSAVYMMDDGDGPNFICCPLPTEDILSDDPPQVRGSNCNSDEVITGAVSRFNFRCTRINSHRYSLTAPLLPCYFGSGSSGGGGVSHCSGHPHSFTVLHNNYFGSDGCSGQPYGSLFVRQDGDDCRDLGASQLVYSGRVEGDTPGAPVPMFAE